MATRKKIIKPGPQLDLIAGCRELARVGGRLSGGERERFSWFAKSYHTLVVGREPLRSLGYPNFALERQRFGDSDRSLVRDMVA